jgi:peptidyl-prolyl cis-trans isomerase C
MKLTMLLTLALSTGVVGSAGVFGCGGSDELPDDVVAEVGDTEITKSDFERSLRFATGGENDPRDYAACAAAKREAVGASGGPQPDRSQLEKQCREEYEKIKSNVMESLIRAEWARQEADARDIVVTDAHVERVIDRAQQSGLLEAEALETAGLGARELFARVRQNQLQGKVTDQLTAGSRDISGKDVAAYYRGHKAEYTVPHYRKARLVVTKTRARAEAAKAELASGRSWATVAKEYSVHFSRNDAGKIVAEWERKDKAGLGAALFKAREGELVGPVRDDDTWAVFVAEEMQRSYLPPLAQVRGEIERLLTSRGRERALAAYRRKYRDKTTCAPGFRVPLCKHGADQADGQSSA